MINKVRFSKKTVILVLIALLLIATSGATGYFLGAKNTQAGIGSGQNMSGKKSMPKGGKMPAGKPSGNGFKK